MKTAVRCKIGYEVLRGGTLMPVVFSKRKDARTFKRRDPGSQIQVIELCNDGSVPRRGRRKF